MNRAQREDLLSAMRQAVEAMRAAERKQADGVAMIAEAMRERAHAGVVLADVLLHAVEGV